MSPIEVARQTWRQTVEHELIMRASAVAYYALMAFVPFLGVVVTLAAYFAPDISGVSGASAGRGGMSVDEFRDLLSRFLPEEAYEVIADEITRLQQRPPLGLLSVGLIVSLWLASSLSGAIIDASNRIYGVVETRSYLALTLTAIGLTILQAVIMLGTLITLVVWPQVSGWLGGSRVAGIGEALTRWLVVALGVLLSFSITMYLGPNVKRRCQWITPGSILGTVIVLASGGVLRWYVHIFGNYGKTYGSLGGVMLLSFWFWLAALVVLIAIQINKVIEDEKEASEP
jgi:membrane protein